MSLPMAATGPLKVLMKPILMVFCWATAGATPSATRATVPKRIRFIFLVLQDTSNSCGDISGSPYGPKALQPVAFRLLWQAGLPGLACVAREAAGKHSSGCHSLHD